MKRSKIKIEEMILYYILRPDLLDEQDDTELTQKELDKYKLVKETLDSHDGYDSGVSYTAVIKDLNTGKFYTTSYNDWDLNAQDSVGPYDEDGVSLDTDLEEVFPVSKTITIYE